MAEPGGIDIKRVLRFIVVGVFSAAINLAAMYLLTIHFQMSNIGQRNLANFFAMVVGVTTAYLLNRQWTWDDSPRKAGTGLFYQYIGYCTSAGAGAILRMGLFAFLDAMTSIHYMVNVVLGIGAAAFLDFILYNKLVFVAHAKHKGAAERGIVDENRL